MTPPLFSQLSTSGFAAMCRWQHREAYGLKNVRSEPVRRHPWTDRNEWFVMQPPAQPAQGDLFARARRS